MKIKLFIIFLLSTGVLYTNTLATLNVNSTWSIQAWSKGNDSLDGVTVVDIDLFD